MSKKSTPARDEAEGVETLAISWRGVDLIVPASIEDWPADAVFAMEDSRPVIAVRAILGRSQTAQVMALDPKPTVRDLQNDLFNAIAAAMGFEGPGE